MSKKRPLFSPRKLAVTSGTDLVADMAHKPNCNRLKDADMKLTLCRSA
jgi:hypothetical protein